MATITIDNTEITKGSKFNTQEVAHQCAGKENNPIIEKEISEVLSANTVTFKGSKVEYYVLAYRWGGIYFQARSGRKKYNVVK